MLQLHSLESNNNTRLLGCHLSIAELGKGGGGDKRKGSTKDIKFMGLIRSGNK